MTYNATIDLGKIKFKWQGNYSASTAYKKDDVVYHNSSAWVAVEDVTGVAPSASATEWDLMVEGSDVNSILTTSGDLLVRGSSGLERLAKGSVGDVLKVGSSGLEYGQSIQAGQIIECISGVCNGNTQTVQSGTYTLPNVTGNQSFSTSYSTVTGSEFTYTPPSGTSRVMYEFQYLFEARSNGGISHHKFFIDNVEVTHARTNLAHEYSTSSHGQLLQTYKWIIDCNASSNNAAAGAFTSWTTPKTMKWQARDYSTSYRIRAHINTWWDGTGASGTNTFRVPTLTITAIA